MKTKMSKVTQKSQIEFIREKITHDVNWAYRALMSLYMAQTEDEKNGDETIHENGVGFTGLDANILTSFAKGYKRYGHLTEKQLCILYRKIGKYAKQLYRISDKEKLLSCMNKEKC
jgi:hypothetical protein